MKQLMEKWRGFLNEEIYGGNAVVYHSTDSVEDVKSILKNGYSLEKNKTDTYGKGLYTVYELEGTNTSQGFYGDVLLKFRVKVNPDEWIIFDEYIYEKFEDGTDSLGGIEFFEQLKRADIPEEKVKEVMDSVKINDLKGKWDSNASLKTAKILRDGDYVDEIDGMFFRGRTDGPVCLVYNPDVATLIAWKRLGHIIKDGDKVVYEDAYVNAMLRRAKGKKGTSKKSLTSQLEVLKKLRDQNFKPAFKLYDRLNEFEQYRKLMNVYEDKGYIDDKGAGFYSVSEFKEAVDSLQDTLSEELSDIINKLATREGIVKESGDSSDSAAKKIYSIVSWEDSPNKDTKTKTKSLALYDAPTQEWNTEVDGQDILGYLKEKR